jgi:hypothetical protein
MNRLKILTLGTQEYLDSFVDPLRADCDKYGYDFQAITIRHSTDISEINHTILEQMVKHIEQEDFQRLCFMDPECRIVKAIPDEWINSQRPVVFFKARTEEGALDPKFVYKNKNGNGERLPCRIIGQPMFISKSDVPWFSMTLALSKAASDLPNKVYTRNEMFIETALEYCQVDYHAEKIVYARHAKTKHTAVKGLWSTEDTIIQHPDIYSIFNDRVAAGNPMFGEDMILNESLLERHTNDLDVLDKINEIMFKEKGDEWVRLEQWLLHPKTGKIKFADYPTFKYHHSMSRKIQDNILTPAVKEFIRIFPDINLALHNAHHHPRTTCV